MMTKLGDLVTSIYLVTKVNKKGLVCEYLDITTGKRVKTSAGGLEQNENNIRALSDEDLKVIADTMTIEKYMFWKQGFQEFIKRLCNVVNSYLPDDVQIRHGFVENGYYADGFLITDRKCDYLGIVHPEDTLEFKLPKERVIIKTKPDE